MISGAHVILFSTDPDADRAFLRDDLGLAGVDAGDGWLILALPPAEVAVHPAETGGVHELYLITDDVAALVADLRSRATPCSDPEDRGWGVLTHVTLPGGGRLGIYEAAAPAPLILEEPAQMFATADDQGYIDALPGIRRKTLCHGGETLLTEFRLEAGAVLPVHDHPQEQTGYLVAGRLRLTIADETREMGPGDSWSIAGDLPHGGTALEDTVAVEVFSPVREDYLP